MNAPDLRGLAAREAGGVQDLREIVHKRWLAGFVRRWHANPDLHHVHDINQGHAGRVAVLLETIFPWTTTRAALWAALTHDMGEGVGDLPGPVKARSAALARAHAAEERAELDDLGIMHDATAEDWARIGLCDRLDAYKTAVHFAPHLAEREEWRAARAWIEREAAGYGVRVI